MNATIARHTILPWHRRHHYADVYKIGVRYFASTIPLGDGGIHRHRKPLPIATFIDLDTIAPKTIRRSDARGLIGPLIEFERRVNNNHVGDGNNIISNSLMKVEAFGNIKSIINKHKHSNSSLGAVVDNGQFAKKMTNLTDTNGTIYCGVCSCKITLTDSDKKEDPTYTLLNKYKGHMQLHGKEQDKLIHKMHARQRIKKSQHSSTTKNNNKQRRRKKMSKILTPKEMNRYYKYKRAREELNLIEEQLQLKNNTNANSNTSKHYQQQKASPNKLKVISRDESFNTLRDFGIKVHAVRRDVNEALMNAADGWLTNVFVQSGGVDGVGMSNDIATYSSSNVTTDAITNMDESENREQDNKHYNGVLIVYSKDTIALAPLLKRAKDRGILTVSASNEVTNHNHNSNSASYFSRSDVLDIQLGPFGKWLEDDTPLDVDYLLSLSNDESSSTLQSTSSSGSTKECSNEEEEDDEEEYIVKAVQSAPISLLISSSNKTKSSSSKKKQEKRHAMGSYAAIPVSDDGLRFMNERIEGGGQEQDGASTTTTAAAAWLLAPSVPTSALNSILKNHDDDNNDDVGQQQHGLAGESIFTRAIKAVTGMFHTFTSNVASSANIFASVNTTPLIEEEKNDTPQLYSNNSGDYGTIDQSNIETTNEEDDYQTRRSTKFYKCLRCGHQEEKWHRFNDFRKVGCTQCSRRVRSLPRHKFAVYSSENNNAENDDDAFTTGAERRKSAQRRYNNNNRRPANKREGSTRQRRPLMGGSGMFVPYLYRQTNKPS